MMKTVFLSLLLIVSTVAFAPTESRVRSSTHLNSFREELGVQEPLGSYDPAGLLTNADQERFERLRFVEIKHGRVAQLAFLGHLLTYAGLRLPGYLSVEQGVRFEDIPAGLAAIEKIPVSGISQIFFFVGFLELAVFRQNKESFPGDFSPGTLFPVGFLGDPTEEEKFDLRAKELNQGRAAMMGILALMVHEKLDGNPYIFFDPSNWGSN